MPSTSLPLFRMPGTENAWLWEGINQQTPANFPGVERGFVELADIAGQIAPLTAAEAVRERTNSDVRWVVGTGASRMAHGVLRARLRVVQCRRGERLDEEFD
jgi:hypothetical protein